MSVSVSVSVSPSFIIRDYNPLSDAQRVFTLASDLFSFSSLFYCETLADFENYKGFVLIDNHSNIDGFILFSKFDSVLYIDFLASKTQKNGHGSALLHHFITYCDSLKLQCYLHIEKVDDVYIKRLSEWYSKFGFVDSQNVLFPLHKSMESSVITMKRTALN